MTTQPWSSITVGDIAKRSAHACKEQDWCCCSPTGLEPDEDCPVHGPGPWPPRCCICGHFLPYSIREQAITEAIHVAAGNGDWV